MSSGSESIVVSVVIAVVSGATAVVSGATAIVVELPLGAGADVPVAGSHAGGTVPGTSIDVVSAMAVASGAADVPSLPEPQAATETNDATTQILKGNDQFIRQLSTSGHCWRQGPLSRRPASGEVHIGTLAPATDGGLPVTLVG